MASSLDDLKQLLEAIRDDLATLSQKSQVVPNQVVLVTGLSDLSERLGLVQAGEFRVGNSKEPGFGFTGVRIGYPAFTYNSDPWHLVGINNDVLQFGLNADDGKAYFAAGAGIIDVSGLTLRSVEYPSASSYILWKDSGGTVTAELINQYVTGTANNLFFNSIKRSSGEPAFVSLITTDVGGAGGASPLTSFQIQSDGDVTINLEAATADGASNQAVNIKTNVASGSTIHDTMYVDVSTKATPANGLGVGIDLRAENSNHEMTTIGIITANYTDVTDGSEDSVIKAWYMLNGVITAKQIAP